MDIGKNCGDAERNECRESDKLSMHNVHDPGHAEHKREPDPE